MSVTSCKSENCNKKRKCLRYNFKDKAAQDFLTIERKIVESQPYDFDMRDAVEIECTYFLSKKVNYEKIR